MNAKNIKRNIITGFWGQFLVIVIGFLVPRFFITSYGSDVNGLLSTITQIFTYMALLEAGIAQASRNLLFKPFQEKNQDRISEISSITKAYFQRFTVIYGLGVIFLAIFLPYVLKTNVAPIIVSTIVILEGMSGVISFYYIQTPSIILSVDGKNYINNSIKLVNKIIGNIVKITMAALGLNIVVLQSVFFLVTVAKVIFYKLYFDKNYSWIVFKKTARKEKLQDRNSYILTEICWTIFLSTDMIVLSSFLSTQMASVYGIYNMIFANTTLLVNSVFASISYLIGYAYHESVEKYERIHDSFNSIFLGFTTILMSVCYYLTIPFVKLYTHGVTDVNYVYPMLPVMFCLIQMLSCSRYTSDQLTGIAGYAKQTSYVSLAEAIINLSLSIIFAKSFGIIGVTFATVIALPIKVIWSTNVADKKVMKRSYRKTISIFGINFLFFFGVVVFSKICMPTIDTYVQFFLWGIVFSIAFGAIGMALNFIVNKECWQVVKKYILKM